MRLSRKFVFALRGRLWRFETFTTMTAVLYEGWNRNIRQSSSVRIPVALCRGHTFMSYFLCETEWNVAISWQLRGLYGCYGVYLAVTGSTYRSFSRKLPPVALMRHIYMNVWPWHYSNAQGKVFRRKGIVGADLLINLSQCSSLSYSFYQRNYINLSLGILQIRQVKLSRDSNQVFGW